MIDTGLGINNIKRITDQLKELPISVITTHVHTDHIESHGAFEELRKKTQSGLGSGLHTFGRFAVKF